MDRKKFVLSVVLIGLCFTWVSQRGLGYVLNGKKWPPASIIYDYHTLTSSWKSAVSYGSSRWNMTGSLFEWAPGESGENDVYRDYIDGAGKVVGATSTWPQLACGTITRMTLRFDTSEKWYVDSGTTPSSSQMDARSVAAHEFGHGLGLAHTQSSRCTGSESALPTMCASYPAGKTYFRSLQQDDKDGVLSLYSKSASRSTLACSSYDLVTPRVDLLYQSISREKAVRSSQVIVRGFVGDVSDTMWNQSSGEYWEEDTPDGTLLSAIPFYTVRIDPIESLLTDQGRIGETVTLTILGESPLAHEGSSPFEIGGEVVVFAERGRIAWRKGTKRVIQLVGAPEESILVLDKGGSFYSPADRSHAFIDLNDLREDIIRLRTSQQK